MIEPGQLHIGSQMDDLCEFGLYVSQGQSNNKLYKNWEGNIEKC